VATHKDNTYFFVLAATHEKNACLFVLMVSQKQHLFNCFDGITETTPVHLFWGNT